MVLSNKRSFWYIALDILILLSVIMDMEELSYSSAGCVWYDGVEAVEDEEDIWLVLWSEEEAWCDDDDCSFPNNRPIFLESEDRVVVIPPEELPGSDPPPPPEPSPPSAL